MYTFCEEKVHTFECIAKEKNGQICRVHPVTVNCLVNHLVTVKILRSIQYNFLPFWREMLLHVYLAVVGLSSFVCNLNVMMHLKVNG